MVRSLVGLAVKMLGIDVRQMTGWNVRLWWSWESCCSGQGKSPSRKETLSFTLAFFFQCWNIRWRHISQKARQLQKAGSILRKTVLHLSLIVHLWLNHRVWDSDSLRNTRWQRHRSCFDRATQNSLAISVYVGGSEIRWSMLQRRWQRMSQSRFFEKEKEVSCWLRNCLERNITE